MKTRFTIMACCASVALLAGTALGQNTYGQTTTSGSASGNENLENSGTANGSATLGTQSQEIFNAKKFMGTEVKDAQGQNLGEIRDVVFNPSSGEVFAAFNVSNNRYALVPWQALSITPSGSHGKYQITLNSTQQELQSGPTVPRNQLQQLGNQTFTQQIYAHYNLQPPSPMGGVGNRSMGGSFKGTGSSGGGLEQNPGSQPK
ncbi:MAG: PRC-barrel domain-containing protein [Limisphaerales bacterium]